jgi:hypothetical protein
MKVIQTNRFCWHCKQTRQFVRLQPNYFAHLVASLLTVGFWLPFWGAIVLYNHVKLGWRCEQCGHRYEKP